MMKRSCLAAAAILACSAVPVLAQSHNVTLPAQPPALPPAPLAQDVASEWTIYPVRDGLFMLSGPSGNVALQVGPDGIALVDTGASGEAAGLLSQIARLSEGHLRFVFLTGSEASHVGNNAEVGAIGENLVSDLSTVGATGSAPILAHEQVMFQMLDAEILDGLPTLTYFVAQKDVHFNGGPISLIHAPGSTSGNSFVMFRRADVVAAGDAYSPDRYPHIDLDRGGSITDYLASLNHLIAITVPEFNQQGGTMVIPGHGRLSDEGDIGEYRDMVTFIHDRVKAMMERGMSLDEIKAARPTFDYDPLYGAAAGDTFVDQIYRSLAQEGQ